MSCQRKPEWLKTRLQCNSRYAQTRKIVDSYQIDTICANAHCPNIGECWSRGIATFMIGGDICTRSCKFCSTKTGKPLPVNINEPRLISECVQIMKLKHVVITSVDRDDLADYGTLHWVNTITEIKKSNPNTTIETLIPDFRGEKIFIDQICKAQPDIVSHNIETVRSLTTQIRNIAKYETSLFTLKQIVKNGVRSKSGIMLGLGETIEEVKILMDDLLAVGCQIMTIGQYLQPTKLQLPVKEYIHPSIFVELKQYALNRGFKYVESGPLVRSSYYAENVFNWI